MFVYLKGHNHHSICPWPRWFWFLLFKDACTLKLPRKELRGREEKFWACGVNTVWGRPHSVLFSGSENFWLEIRLHGIGTFTYGGNPAVEVAALPSHGSSDLPCPEVPQLVSLRPYSSGTMTRFDM